MRSQHAKGFSLIELLVVIAIVGILAAIAAPQYQQYVIRANFAKSMVPLYALDATVTVASDPDLIPGCWNAFADPTGYAAAAAQASAECNAL